MTNISHKPMKDGIRDKIENQFAEFLGSLSAEQAENFYQSFFTESEQIMFVKRLAIITLLEKGAPYSHIATVLEMSPSTVRRINDRREDEEFDELIDLSESQDLRDRLWTALKILIDENVHHYGASEGDGLTAQTKHLTNKYSFIIAIVVITTPFCLPLTENIFC